FNDSQLFDSSSHTAPMHYWHIRLRRTDTDNLDVVPLPQGIEQQISGFAFSAAKPLMVSSQRGEEIKLWTWDNKGFSEKGRLEFEKGSPGIIIDDNYWRFIIGPKCSYLQGDAANGDVIIWRVADRKKVYEFQTKLPLANVVFDGSETRLAATTSDGTLHIWQT